VWEILALRYATQDRPARVNFLHPPDPHDAPMPIDYFIWVLRQGARNIVVDTGFSADVAAARGRTLLQPVQAVLAAVGVVAAEVEDVVLTHLHYDHAGNLALFPRARFHIQDREMTFATGRHLCGTCLNAAFEVEDVVAMLRALYADRVVFHDGEGAVAEGVTLHRIGGHTDGLQCLRVATARGPVVLASDAAHFYANMDRQNPFPILFDFGEMIQGWRRLRRLAEGDDSRIVPGHDPEVLRRYPRLDGIEAEAVALHLPPV
jgi:glyoxylase-like metal-dependent hydrolase (beta-lactamase superfamily II)